MDNIWLEAALWIGLALAAAVISIRFAISVALVEIVVGAIAGNLIGLTLTEWVTFLAGFGAILLTFLAGTEVDRGVIRSHFWPCIAIGLSSFIVPYLGVLLYAHHALAWSWSQAQIAGLAMSTTSVAIVYAVMIETGFNQTTMGKIILAACFVTDLGTVATLGVVFAHFDHWFAVFGALTALAFWLVPKLASWSFPKFGTRVSEPQIKLLALALLALGGLAKHAGSEAVLPAYLLGMALAPMFLTDNALVHRLRSIAFAVLTPFFFLKAGSLIDSRAFVASAGLIAVFLALKMVAKFAGVLPLTRLFRFEAREGLYTTLMMSTGLTFGSIAALYGLTNGIIDQQQYTVLVTAVILSGVIPTIIAQRWFEPARKPAEQETEHV